MEKRERLKQNILDTIGGSGGTGNIAVLGGVTTGSSLTLATGSGISIISDGATATISVVGITLAGSRVGINTTTPAYELDVRGTIYTLAETFSGLIMQNWTGRTYSIYSNLNGVLIIGDETSGVVRASIDAAGNTAIGPRNTPASGSPILIVSQTIDSDNPTGMPASTAGIFAKSVSGSAELFAVNESGCTFQLTASAGGSGSIPSNIIAHFNGAVASIPSGWSEFTAARGRMIVGVPLSGTVGGTVGTALTNQQDKTHTHTIPQGAVGAGSGESANQTSPTGTAATSDVLAYIQQPAVVSA